MLSGRGRGHGAREEDGGPTGEWKFRWKHNALRHSFISYRVAKIQNVAQVSLEAGNSPQVIFKNYRELVRPADAKAWFSIAPGDGGKVIVLPAVGKTRGQQQNGPEIEKPEDSGRRAEGQRKGRTAWG